MAFCSPFAQLAASPLAAAFPQPAAAAANLAANHNNGSSGSASDDFVDAVDGFISPAAAAPARPAPQRALTCAPLRAGSYCLAGSLSECRAAKTLGRVSCGPSCAGQSCSSAGAADASARQLLPQHMSLPPFRDLDALLAAAACKPGYHRASTDLGTVGAPAAAPAAACMGSDVCESLSCSSMAEEPAGQAGLAAAPAVCAVLEQYGARPVADGAAGGIADAALGLIAEHTLADTFYLYDLGEVSRLYQAWATTMPRVMPFYAVKCNPEPSMVAMLAALGAGFDCASIQELQLAAAHGVPQDRIIFANPCKRPADFRYAAEHSVAVTTFDCVSELHKIAAGYPSFQCVLRIRCDDASAKINLGLKYGADMCDVPLLLGMARDLGLQVVGVSFHVGSGCQNVGVYADAIAAARQAFDMGASYGFNMTLLDIGGGFTAPYDEPTGRLFYTTAATINTALDTHFPPGCGVRVIAEPGRYFAETSATLFTTILGQREGLDALGGPFRDYWLSDGTYGSFRIQVAVDGLEPTYSVLRSPLLPHVADQDVAAETEPVLLPCRLWGNSDRDGDVVHKAALLPALRDGDWLMFPFAGAYTICAASNYGGVRFAQPLKLFIYSGAVHRDTCGWDMAAGEAAAVAAGWAAAVVPTAAGGNGSCCSSDVAVPAVSVSVSDSDNSSNSEEGGVMDGSPHSTVNTCCGADDASVVVGAEGVAGCCLLCGAGGCGGVVAGAQEGCVCGAGAGAAECCMSVASEGTGAAGVVLEGCGDSQGEAEITSMVLA